MNCTICLKTIQEPPKGSITTGYGINPDGKIVCFSCCGFEDRARMMMEDRITLYLVKRNGEYRVTNWPGTLDLSCRVTKGRHNIARTRYDAYFAFGGRLWHGVNYGENSQILHCKASQREHKVTA